MQRLPEMGLVFGPPKSNKSRRTIPLPAASAKVLRTHRANQAVEALPLGPAWVDSGLVFTSTVDTVIEPRNLNRMALYGVLQAVDGVGLKLDLGHSVGLIRANVALIR